MTKAKEISIPRAHTGDPEAGLQKDLFGDTHLFMPQAKKKVTQISMDDQLKLNHVTLAALKDELSKVTPWTDYKTQEQSKRIQKTISRQYGSQILARILDDIHREKEVKAQTRTGKCQDPNCDYPEEETRLNYYNGRWICDGCLEAEWDNEEFMEANRQDMIESGWI